MSGGNVALTNGEGSGMIGIVEESQGVFIFTASNSRYPESARASLDKKFGETGWRLFDSRRS